MEPEENDQIILNEVDSAQIVGKKGISLKQKIIIYTLLGIVSIIILIIIFLIIISSKSISNNTLPIKVIIKCIYNVEDTSS